MYRRVALVLFVVFALSSCNQKPRYEFHSIRNDAIFIVFDNQTGTVYSRFIAVKKWEYEVPTETAENKEIPSEQGERGFRAGLPNTLAIHSLSNRYQYLKTRVSILSLL